MRHGLRLMTATVVTTIPTVVHAHGGLAGGHDIGSALLWLYGMAFGGLGVYLVLRFCLRGNERPEKKALRRRIGELEDALASCLKQLQIADEYPLECGLSNEQRQHRFESVATIRRLIEEEKLKLEST